MCPVILNLMTCRQAWGLGNHPSPPVTVQSHKIAAISKWQWFYSLINLWWTKSIFFFGEDIWIYVTAEKKERSPFSFMLTLKICNFSAFSSKEGLISVYFFCLNSWLCSFYPSDQVTVGRVTNLQVVEAQGEFVRVSWVGVQNATSYRILWRRTDGEILEWF